MDALTTFNKRHTSQREQADPRQVKNNAGGYTFQLGPLAQARRFLVLGSNDGTYYARPQELTKTNGEHLIRLAETDHDGLLNLIVAVSTSGAAPKPGPALFALAIASSYGTPEQRDHAMSRLPEVARTGTHLFTYLTYVQQFRGWGRGLRRGVGGWYDTKRPDKLAYQVTKYRQRGGWTHRDALRLSHPQLTGGNADIAAWITKGTVTDALPPIIHGYIAAQEPGADLPALIREYGLSWEMLPTDALTRRDVWDALLDWGLPLGALVRQLPRLTNLGIIAPLGGRTNEIAARLTDREAIRRARLHPVTLLNASFTYASGRGMSQTWTPVPRIVDALEAGFYAAFDTVEPAGRRTLLALDVSASMAGAAIAGMSLNARTASAALAMVTLATEPETYTVGFTGAGEKRRNPWGGSSGWGSGVEPIPLRAGMSLREAVNTVDALPMGYTDCAQPMLYAAEHNLEVDTFVIYTDNETWHGDVHPHQALRDYRAKTGIPARLVVVGMTATGFSIADPADAGMLDVVGFDTSTPSLISDFSAGRL